MHTILTLVGKDLRLLLRDKGGVFFTFVFPLVYAIFFGAIFNNMAGDYRSRPTPLLLVDEDKTPASAAMVKSLSEADELAVTLTSREDGVNRVRKGEKPVCVVIPEGFGESRARVFGGKPLTLQLASDPARTAESGMIAGLLNKYVFLSLKDSFTDPAALRAQVSAARDMLRTAPDEDAKTVAALEALFGGLDLFANLMPATPASRPTSSSANAAEKATAANWEPLRLEKLDITIKRNGPRNFYAVSFPQGLLWGILGCTASFGVGSVMERTRGTLRRLRMSPAGAGHILAARAIACLITLFLISIFMLTFAWLVFKVVPNSLALLAVAVACVGLAFVGLTLLLSNFGRNENSAAGLCWGILTILAMLGGGMVPLNVMPGWMQTLGSVSPVKWGIMAVEGALWRNYTFAEMARPCGFLLGFAVVLFALGTAISRRTAR